MLKLRITCRPYYFFAYDEQILILNKNTKKRKKSSNLRNSKLYLNEKIAQI